MRSRDLLLALGASALAGCASTGAVTRSALAQQNTAVVLAFLDLSFNRHEVQQAFRLYVGPYYRQHDPQLADGIDAAAAALTRQTSELAPGTRLEVKRTIAQGDLVAVHSRVVHHAAEADQGGGQAVVDIFRLERGRIVEHWDVIQDVPQTAANSNTLF
jgi:predicted SnoaL-like aldol condensation-catalyzing enzyme